MQRTKSRTKINRFERQGRRTSGVVSADDREAPGQSSAGARSHEAARQGQFTSPGFSPECSPPWGASGAMRKPWFSELGNFQVQRVSLGWHEDQSLGVKSRHWETGAIREMVSHWEE